MPVERTETSVGPAVAARHAGAVPAAVVLVVAYLAGALPFSFVVARLVAGADLRRVDAGTVSGTGLYRVAGFGPMVVGGLLDVGKGAVGPLLAGERPVLAAVAAGVAVAGHNWSPLLRGAGGRGISPAMGALAVVAWPGVVLLLLGLTLGKLAGSTGFGSFVAQALLIPVLAWHEGTTGLVAGGLILAVLWAKRALGNQLPSASLPRGRVIASRLLFDHDAAFLPR